MSSFIKRKLRRIPLFQSIYYGLKRLKYRSLKRLRIEDLFTRYHKENFWNDQESVSGSGSNYKNTGKLVAELRPMLDALGIQSVLDIPCGDFQWMSRVDLEGINYVGGDVVKEMIERGENIHGKACVKFRHIDLLGMALPTSDIVLCRDCLVHFSFRDVGLALLAIKRSGAKYLATTHFPAARRNYDIVTGDWRRLNFTVPPFSWPDPEAMIEECSTEGDGDYADKTLAFWRIDQLPLV